MKSDFVSEAKSVLARAKKNTEKHRDSGLDAETDFGENDEDDGKSCFFGKK